MSPFFYTLYCLGMQVKVWQMSNKECIITLHQHQGAVSGVDWDDKGERLASVSDDRTLIVYKNIAQ